MSASISIDNRLVLEFLHGLRDKIDDMTPVMDSIGAEMETRVSNRFETQTDPMGVPWSPWAESTKASYPEKGHRFFLYRLGDLLGGISHQADQSSVTYGFDVPYAAYHELGTDKMPRRGLLTADPEAGPLSDSDEAEVLALLSDYLSSV